jgi:hypothetical protein
MTIPELLEHYGIEHREAGHRHVRPGWVGIDCPRCSPGSGKFKLGINLEKGYANCWTCGSVRLAEAISELAHISVGEAFRSLSESRLLLQQHTAPPPRKPGGKLVIPPGVGPMTRTHRLYLYGRCFDPDEVERLWGVQCIGLAGRLSWRLWIPIISEGKVVSWTTRATGSDPMRYISARPDQELIPHKTLLYGEDYARHAVVICEGTTDAWRIGPGAVATMGLSVTLSQVYRMSRFPVRVICFDNEPEAQRRAERLAKQLQPLPGETHVVRIETGKDVAEADSAEVEELRHRFLGA